MGQLASGRSVLVRFSNRSRGEPTAVTAFARRIVANAPIALDQIVTPDPVWAPDGSWARSSTRTSSPARCNATPAVRPPMPPPMMIARISGSDRGRGERAGEGDERHVRPDRVEAGPARPHGGPVRRRVVARPFAYALVDRDVDADGDRDHADRQQRPGTRGERARGHALEGEHE